MRITVVALGTRGDVQPVIALSKGLQASGHAVTLIAGSNFADWIAGHGLGCLPSVDIEAVMSSDRGLTWTESSRNPMKQVQMMRELLNEHRAELYTPIMQSAASSDLLISGFTSEAFVQAVSQKSGVPYLSVLLQPQRPTSSGPAMPNPIVARGSSPLNRLMSSFIERVLWSVVAESVNELRTRHLQLPPHTAPTWIRVKLTAPTVYGFSRHVVPPASDWPSRTVVSGYWFLDEGVQWQPPPELAAFLAAGEPPVYIGFGSMSHRDPGATLSLILEAVRRSGQRALIATGWSSARAGDSADALPSTVLTIASAPHDWLFPRVSAVVHHGGAGTTAAGLRAGKPTMIIPHMSDQPYWGARVYALGVGVKPVPRHKLTAERLARGLHQLATDARLRDQARALGEQIRAERGVENAVRAIEQFGAELAR
jgi:sterol 3beta-glucosyltransferase